MSRLASLPVLLFCLDFLGCGVLAVSVAAHPKKQLQDSVVVRNINGIDQGTTATFECRQLRDGKETPANVLDWFFEDHKLSLADKGRIFAAPLKTKHKLAVMDALPSDSGSYTCVADVNGKTVNASGRIRVYCPIRTKIMSVTRAILGESATLKCDGECFDSIFWARNTNIVQGSRYTVRDATEGSVLHIRNVTMADAGNYTCEFLSGAKNGGLAYQQVELTVSVPTDAVTMTMSRVNPKVGQDLEIVCQANGVPLPESVVWLNNSQLIRPSTRVTATYNSLTGVGRLRLNPLTRYDSVTIQCRYQQELLRHKFDARWKLEVTGRPDPPRDLQLQAVLKPQNMLIIHLNWKPPIYSGKLKVLAYHIRYWDRRTCDTDQKNCTVSEHWTGAGKRSFVLRKTTPHGEMCFMMQSVNNDGLSLDSEGVCTIPFGVETKPVPTNQPSTAASELLLTHKPSVPFSSFPPLQKEFQFALTNVEELCSSSFMITKSILTSALARHFSLFAGTLVPVSHLTAESLAVMGGIVYYRGTLVNPQADIILRQVARHTEAGGVRLLVSGSYFDFLASCPTEVNANIYNCSFKSLDAAALTCTTSTATENAHISCSSEYIVPPQLALILITVFGGLLVILMPCSLMLCYCLLRMRKLNIQYRTGDQVKSKSVVNTTDTTHSKRQVTLDSAIGGMSRGSSGSVGSNSVFHGD